MTNALECSGRGGVAITSPVEHVRYLSTIDGSQPWEVRYDHAWASALCAETCSSVPVRESRSALLRGARSQARGPARSRALTPPLTRPH
jgi:hypothetical protein